MDTHLLQKKLNKIDLNTVNKYLLFLLIILIPLTHKEHFSLFDNDLVWSKFVLVILGGLGLYYFFKNKTKYIKDPIFVFLLILLFFQIFSILQSRDKYNSLRMIAFLGSVFMVYPSVRTFLSTDQRGYKKLIGVSIISFLFSFVFFFIQKQLFLLQKVKIGGIWPVPDYPTRFGSTFWDVNHYGIYLVSFILLMLGSFFVFRRKTIKFLVAASGLLSLVALYNTSSRSAFIGLFVGVIFFLLFFLLKRFKKAKERIPNWIFILGVVIVTTLPLVFVTLFSDQIREAFLYRAVSFFSHLFLIKAGIQTGLQNFLFGIGTNSFYAHFRETELANAYYYIDAAAMSYKLPLHNLWLEVFAETGIVSFVFFASFWLVLLASLIKMFLRKVDYIALGFASGIIAFLTAGLMYSYKSEFFWFYVIFAGAYAMNWVLPQLDYKLKIKEYSVSFFEFIFGRNIDWRKLVNIALATIIVFIPIFFVFEPLNPKELMMINSGNNSVFGIFSGLYVKMLNMFRYVFGNYSYVPRIPSILFYFGSVGLLLALFRRYLGLVRGYLAVAILMSLISVVVVLISASSLWFWIFIVLIILNIVSEIFHFKNKSYYVNTKLNVNLLTLILGIGIVMVIFSSLTFYKSSYKKDETFLIELAYNRGLFNKSAKFIDKDVDKDLIRYYCEELVKKDSKYIIIPCSLEIVYLPAFQEINPSVKNLVIGKNTFIEKWNNKIKVYVNLDMAIIQIGDFSIITFEPKKIFPL